MISRRWMLGGSAVLALGALSGCSRLSLLNAVLPKDAGSRQAERDVPFGPDPRQKLDVYVPTRGQPRGVVVFVYGGNWSSGSKSDYSFAGRALAAAGYVAVLPDYRLVPAVRYPAFVQDAAKATAWGYRNAGRLGADRRRLFLLGHSAGAYNAIMAAVAPEFLATEGLSPHILAGFAGLSGPYDFYPFDVEASEEAFKGVANGPRTQPVNRVGRAAVPPMLLVTGDQDTIVEPRNTRAMTAALRKNGHAVETKIYPGLGHPDTVLALARPLRGKAPVLADVIAFFDGRR